jgi:hypothetical protein
MKNAIAILVLMFTSMSLFAQHDHHPSAAPENRGTPTFKDAKTGTAYTQYLVLKDELVNSNSSNAKVAASKLKKALTGVPNSATAIAHAEKIASSSDLAEQRLQFSTLSNAMKDLIKQSKLSAGAVYVEFCPMANDHQGAYWLSNEKEIKNPYFGEQMLKCGSVKETLQ